MAVNPFFRAVLAGNAMLSKIHVLCKTAVCIAHCHDINPMKTFVANIEMLISVWAPDED